MGNIKTYKGVIDYSNKEAYIVCDRIFKTIKIKKSNFNFIHDDEVEFEECTSEYNSKNMLKLLKKVSARNLNLIKPTLTPAAEELVKKWTVIKRKRKAKVKINGGSNNQQLFSMGVFENIDSYDKCIAATQQVLQIAKSND